MATFQCKEIYSNLITNDSIPAPKSHSELNPNYTSLADVSIASQKDFNLHQKDIVRFYNVRIYHVTMNSRKYWRIEWISPETKKRIYKHYGETKHGLESSKELALNFYNDLLKKLASQLIIKENDTSHLDMLARSSNFFYKDYNSFTSDEIKSPSHHINSAESTANSTPLQSISSSPDRYSSKMNHLIDEDQAYQNFQSQPFPIESQEIPIYSTHFNSNYNNISQTLPLNLDCSTYSADPNFNGMHFQNANKYDYYINSHQKNEQMALCVSPISQNFYDKGNHFEESPYKNNQGNNSFSNSKHIDISYPDNRKSFKNYRNPKTLRTNQKATGRIYLLKIRNVLCWRAEWYDSKSGKRKTRQFAETVHGSDNARLKALEVLVKCHCVPDKLLREASSIFNYKSSKHNSEEFITNSSYTPTIENSSSVSMGKILPKEIHLGNTSPISFSTSVYPTQPCNLIKPPDIDTFITRNDKTMTFDFFSVNSTKQLIKHSFSDIPFGPHTAMHSAIVQAQELSQRGHTLVNVDT